MSDIKKQDDVLVGWIEAFKEQEQEEPADEFAERFMEKVANAQNLLKVYKEQYEKKVHNMKMYLKGLHYVHGQQFRNETKQLIAKQKRGKTYEYDAGSAGYRAVPEHIVFSDVKKAKMWAIENFKAEELHAAISGINKTPLLVALMFNKLQAQGFAECITDLNKTPFMNHIKATGEIPPGVELIDKFDKFTINGKAVDETPLLPEPLPTAEDVRGILEEKKDE